MADVLPVWYSKIRTVFPQVLDVNSVAVASGEDGLIHLPQRQNVCLHSYRSLKSSGVLKLSELKVSTCCDRCFRTRMLSYASASWGVLFTLVVEGVNELRRADKLLGDVDTSGVMLNKEVERLKKLKVKLEGFDFTAHPGLKLTDMDRDGFEKFVSSFDDKLRLLNRRLLGPGEQKKLLDEIKFKIYPQESFLFDETETLIVIKAVTNKTVELLIEQFGLVTKGSYSLVKVPRFVADYVLVYGAAGAVTANADGLSDAACEIAAGLWDPSHGIYSSLVEVVNAAKSM